MPSRKRLTGGSSKPIAFRLPEAEHEEWMARLRASGLTQSEFFRQVVCANSGKAPAKQIPTRDLKRLEYLVRKAGNNINQLARRAHSERLAGKLNQTTFESISYQLELLGRYLKATVGHARQG